MIGRRISRAAFAHSEPSSFTTIPYAPSNTCSSQSTLAFFSPAFPLPDQLDCHTIMGFAFDQAPERPENIDAILNGLDRYNPETTGVFQDYVAQQCQDQSYDCYANLALLKL